MSDLVTYDTSDMCMVPPDEKAEKAKTNQSTQAQGCEEQGFVMKRKGKVNHSWEVHIIRYAIKSR